MIWLALYFPKLQLDAYLLQQSEPLNHPVIIVDKQSYQVVQSCSLAQQKGVLPGCHFAQACLLLSDAKLLLYRPEIARKQLQTMAQTLYQVCADIVVGGCDRLLLRCDRMLQYYQTETSLLTAIQDCLQSFNYQYQSASATSQLAACLLAQHAPARHLCLQTQKSSQTLAKLSINCLPVTAKQLKNLHRMGFKNIADLQRLPSYQVGRHLGSELHQLIAELQADQQLATYYQPSEHFTAELELMYEVGQAEALLFPLRRLFMQLQNYLTRRAVITDRLSVILHFRTEPAKKIVITSQQASAQSGLWLELVKYQLEKIQLTAPVLNLTLNCQTFITAANNQTNLFSQQDHHSKQTLFARLSSRCRQISKYALVKDYRLKHAYRTIAWHQTSQLPKNYQIFSQLHAGPIYLCQHQAIDKQKFTLLAGPQRLVTHWWSQEAQQQDYFYAINQQQQYIRLIKTPTLKWYQDALFA